MKISRRSTASRLRTRVRGSMQPAHGAKADRQAVDRAGAQQRQQFAARAHFGDQPAARIKPAMVLAQFQPDADAVLPDRAGTASAPAAPGAAARSARRRPPSPCRAPGRSRRTARRSLRPMPSASMRVRGANTEACGRIKVGCEHEDTPRMRVPGAMQRERCVAAPGTPVKSMNEAGSATACRAGPCPLTRAGFLRRRGGAPRAPRWSRNSRKTLMWSRRLLVSLRIERSTVCKLSMTFLSVFQRALRDRIPRLAASECEMFVEARQLAHGIRRGAGSPRSARAARTRRAPRPTAPTTAAPDARGRRAR